MNPYLRIKQPTGPATAAHLYAKYILHGEWPEMGPSPKDTTIRAEILTESPIDEEPERRSRDSNAAQATIGLFFGDQLINEFPVTKWLLVTDHEFEYSGNQESNLTLFHGGPHVTEEKIPSSLGELRNDVKLVLVDAYKKWQPKPPTNLDNTKPAFLAAFRAIDSWAPRALVIDCQQGGSPPLLRGDRVYLVDRYGDPEPYYGQPETGEPERGVVLNVRYPNDEYNDTAEDASLDPLDKYAEDVSWKTNFNPPSVYVKWDADGAKTWISPDSLVYSELEVYITYAVWRDGGVSKGPELTVFAVEGATTQLHFTVRDAVEAAYDMCRQYPSSRTIFEQTKKLSKLVMNPPEEL